MGWAIPYTLLRRARDFYMMRGFISREHFVFTVSLRGDEVHRAGVCCVSLVSLSLLSRRTSYTHTHCTHPFVFPRCDTPPSRLRSRRRCVGSTPGAREVPRREYKEIDARIRVLYIVIFYITRHKSSFTPASALIYARTLRAIAPRGELYSRRGCSITFNICIQTQYF